MLRFLSGLGPYDRVVRGESPQVAPGGSSSEMRPLWTPNPAGWTLPQGWAAFRDRARYGPDMSGWFYFLASRAARTGPKGGGAVDILYPKLGGQLGCLGRPNEPHLKYQEYHG